MSKRLSKIDPLDIDELFSSPSLEGMLSFREVDPSVAALRLKAKTSIDENSRRVRTEPNQTIGVTPPPVAPLPVTPIGLTPIAQHVKNVRSTFINKTIDTEAAPPAGLPPIGVTDGAPALDQVLSQSEILAEVQDASRLTRSRGKIIRALKVEDGHSGNENSVYWYLWRAGRQIRNSRSHFVQIGYALISKGVGLDRTNVQNILRTLELKLAIRMVTPATVKSSTVYEVFSCEQILSQRREAGLLWVQRYGSRRVDFVDDTGTTVIPTGTAPTGISPRVGVTPTPSVGVAPAQPVGATPTQIVRQPISKDTSSSLSSILQALNQYGTPDDDIAQKLLHACKREAPDCTEVEIVHFVHQKAALIRNGRISNPLGFLLTAVPKCFTGQAFVLYREQEQKRQDQDKIRREQEEAEIREWKCEQELVLSDPNASDQDKQFAKQILGIE